MTGMFKFSLPPVNIIFETIYIYLTHIWRES